MTQPGISFGFYKRGGANQVEKQGHQCPARDDLPCPMSCFSMIGNRKTGGALFPQWDNLVPHLEFNSAKARKLIINVGRHKAQKQRPGPSRSTGILGLHTGTVDAMPILGNPAGRGSRHEEATCDDLTVRSCSMLRKISRPYLDAGFSYRRAVQRYAMTTMNTSTATNIPDARKPG